MHASKYFGVISTVIIINEKKVFYESASNKIKYLYIDFVYLVHTPKQTKKSAGKTQAETEKKSKVT